MRVIQERDVNNTLAVSSTRGNDLSGTLAQKPCIPSSLSWTFKFAGVAVSVWLVITGRGAEQASTANAVVSTNPAASISQPLTAEEIQRALGRMRQCATNSRQTGSWQLVEISNDPEIALTNVVYEWRGPEGQFLLRKEITQRTKAPKSKSRLALHHLHLNNTGGYWAIWGNTAIHYPDPSNGRRRTAKEDPEEPQPVVSIGFSVDFDLYDSTMFRLTGQRMQSDAGAHLLVLSEPKENARAFMETEFKRKMPLLFRPFLTTSKVKEVVVVLIPARVETVIDQETGAFISSRYFAKDGSLMMGLRGWERCDDLPLNSYALPAGVMRVYPKNDKEARHLESKARSEEEKLAK
jgi:hypothetical protein